MSDFFEVTVGKKKATTRLVNVRFIKQVIPTADGRCGIKVAGEVEPLWVQERFTVIRKKLMGEA